MFEVSVESQVKYLRRRVGELEILLSKAQNVDFELAKKIGHQVKGNAVTFGLDVLTPHGVKLEDAAVAGSSVEVIACAKEFLQAVQKVLTARSAL